jgi:hypothetical protein
MSCRKAKKSSFDTQAVGGGIQFATGLRSPWGLRRSSAHGGAWQHDRRQPICELPTVPIVASTLANRVTPWASHREDWGNIGTQYLLSGDSLIAVDVHQKSNNNDIGLAVQLDVTTNIATIPSPIPVTEINYHPPEGGASYAADDYDYLEIKNTGVSSVNLPLMYFGAGVQFVFPSGANSDLAPGHSVISAAGSPPMVGEEPRAPRSLEISGWHRQAGRHLSPAGAGTNLAASEVLQRFALRPSAVRAIWNSLADNNFPTNWLSSGRPDDSSNVPSSATIDRSLDQFLTTLAVNRRRQRGYGNASIRTPSGKPTFFSAWKSGPEARI